MTKFTRSWIAVALGLACAVGIVSCGGGTSGNVVAQVGNVSIDRATLSRWMEAVVGGDYFEHLGRPVPHGLVSDPPNYPRCIVAAEKIVPRSTNGQSAITRSQIASKCRQLYQALKEQTLELLISIESRIGEGEELGIPATDAEVNRLFARVKAEQFPTQAQYQAYLAQRDWTPSIEIMQLKRNIVTSKIEAKFQARGAGWQRPYAESLLNSIKKWTAKTSCRPGYVVSLCKEYKASASHTSPTSPPAILLEELAGR